MKRALKFISLCTVCALAFSMIAGCSGKDAASSSKASSSKASSSSSSKASTSSQSASKEIVGLVKDAPEVDQFAPPEQGEEIAVLEVEGYGTIKMRLFPENAPKAVENFKTLAKEGKYDGVPFHRVIKDFMIQTGDTSLNGGDGKDIWGSGFGIEVSDTLHHYSGAVAMARTGDMKAGQSSQFYIVSNENIKQMSDSQFDSFEAQLSAVGNSVTYSDKVKNLYNEKGGYPPLDMQYTVFGQVFEGLDVVDKIAAVECEMGQDGQLSSPVEKVVITKAQIVAYEG